MKLDSTDALARLADHEHGVLSTVHPSRGIDAVPCVYVVDPAGFVGIPIDRVKPKASTELQRVRNLEADPRATLLVDHWDRADWSQLWWVRAELRWESAPTDDDERSLAVALGKRYPQYRDLPFARVLVFSIVRATGWSAT